jgi:hypothetical protein
MFLVSLGDVLMWVGACVAFGGFAVLGYQCLLWLRDGEWTPMPIVGDGDNGTLANLNSGIERIEWRGVQSIALWIVDGVAGLPASLSFVIIGAIVVGIVRPEVVDKLAARSCPPFQVTARAPGGLDDSCWPRPPGATRKAPSAGRRTRLDCACLLAI